MRLDELGRLAFEDFRQSRVAPVSQCAIGERRQVDNFEFVATERQTTDVRREDGGLLKASRGDETPKHADRIPRTYAESRKTPPSDTGFSSSEGKPVFDLMIMNRNSPTTTASRSLVLLALTQDENRSEHSNRPRGKAK